MNWKKQIRGQYLFYTLPSEFTVSALLKQTKAINDDLKDSPLDVALDLRGLEKLDGAGGRFINNLSASLEKQGRKIVYIGGKEEVLVALEESSFVKKYENIADFELEFHEMSPAFAESLLKLAPVNAGLSSLSLICPLCGNREVSGFILDEQKYKQEWNDSEITPMWEPASSKVESLDFAVYQVAVCTTCYFASLRPDFFTIVFPEGEVLSRLKTDEINNLKMTTSTRKQIMNQFRDADGDKYFNPPREKQVAYLSWLLHEACQKQMHSDRKLINAYDLVLANLYMCKYAENEEQINEHLHTALAWSNSLVENRQLYSGKRLMMGLSYQISILLALGKVEEAKAVWTGYRQEYAPQSEYHFWVKRVASLMSGYLGEVE
ncbi:MAG: STAS domain-containing protein [Fibrobacter sp.]|nr:STAS domain-containing protein [Fibrobacter sp.]